MLCAWPRCIGGDAVGVAAFAGHDTERAQCMHIACMLEHAVRLMRTTDYTVHTACAYMKSPDQVSFVARRPRPLRSI